MIAVATLLISAVVILTSGVVAANSSSDDMLSVFGLSVRTTPSQIFLTGAICTWVLVAGMCMLRLGLRRSRLRRMELRHLRDTGATALPIPVDETESR